MKRAFPIATSYGVEEYGMPLETYIVTHITVALIIAGKSGGVPEVMVARAKEIAAEIIKITKGG